MLKTNKGCYNLQQPLFVINENCHKTYTYDLAGNRTGFTLEKGGETVHNISYSYDNLNRLSTVSENGAAKKSYKISRSRHRFDDSSCFLFCRIPIFLYLSSVFFPIKSLTASVAVCLVFPFKRYSAPWANRIFVSLRTNKALRNHHGKPVRECNLRCYNFLCFMPHRLPPLPEPSAGFRETPWDRYSSKSDTTPK